MKQTVLLILMALLVPAALGAAETRNDPDAYALYQQANERYKLKKLDEAKDTYLQLINTYPDSESVPYALYMLSFIETDSVKVIDYLSLIRRKYTDFRYYTNALEKLGDVFYVLGNHTAAIEQYQKLTTDKAFYMLALLYSANGFVDMAIDASRRLLAQTQDLDLAYKAYLIESKIYLDTRQYEKALPVIRQSVELRRYGFDKGARALFNAGKYYFYRTEIASNEQKALYTFSLLKTTFPMAVESTLANSYIQELKRQNIVKTDVVRWVADAFSESAPVAYQAKGLTPVEEAEKKAEEVTMDAEGAAGQIVRADLLEYVVRIGEYKDLSVANLVASDIARAGQNIPLGIYYRNDAYYAEIRGLKKLEEAREMARKMLAMGYTDTRVVEFTRVVEYAR